MKTLHLVSLATSILAAGAAAGCTSDSSTKLPRTCQDVADADPGARDDEYTLYLDGDVKQPWVAFCKDMRHDPVEYLPLVRTGGSYNFSELSVRHAAGTTRLRTHYTKVRIDPETLELDVNDREFGDLAPTPEVVGPSAAAITVTKMPFATAGACQADAGSTVGDQPQDAPANVDLTGTPFVLSNDFCFGGTSPKMVDPAMSSDDSAVTLVAGTTSLGAGNCAWTSPSIPACPGVAPFATGTALLQLDYLGAEER